MAAGLKPEEAEWTQQSGLVWVVRRADGIRKEIRWNPIDDDGDALRLAVKLGIDVFPWQDKHRDRHDLYAATRRAIVRAAAEIGRQMQEGGAAMRCAYTKEEVRGALLEALTRIRALPVHANAIRMAHKHAEDAIAKATKGEA